MLNATTLDYKDDTTGRAVFFDWDGTLVNSLPVLHKSHNHVRERLGFPLWSLEEYRTQMYRSSLDLYPDLYKENAETALSYLYEFFEKNHLKELEVISGALPLLQNLKNHNFQIGLISNKKHDYLIREIAHLGWEEYFSIIIGAGYAEEDKPHPAPLKMALANTGQQPCRKKIWYIGDTRTDIETARNAGCASVLILHGENKDSLIKDHKPDHIFDNFPELETAILQNIQKNAC